MTKQLKLTKLARDTWMMVRKTEPPTTGERGETTHFFANNTDKSKLIFFCLGNSLASNIAPPQLFWTLRRPCIKYNHEDMVDENQENKQ